MLILLFLILDLLGMSAFFLLAEPDFSVLWGIPILIGGFLALNLIYILTAVLISLFLSKKKPVEHPNRFCAWMIGVAMRWLMTVMRVRVRLIGREKLPKGPCVLVSNHVSDFDPMVVLSVRAKRKIIYISKEANFRIPVAGPFIYRAGFLAIDRENAMRAMRTLKRAAEMLKADGVDVGIYPEGTRNRTGELLEFKEGAFLLAKRAGAPLVVMTTKGSAQIKQNFPWHGSRVELKILSVLQPEEIRDLSLAEISERVRGMILAELNEGKAG